MAGRDLMAPDTEPTDEELALVMRAAGESANRSCEKANAWVAARIEEVAQVARGSSPGRRGRPHR